MASNSSWTAGLLSVLPITVRSAAGMHKNDCVPVPCCSVSPGNNYASATNEMWRGRETQSFTANNWLNVFFCWISLSIFLLSW